MPTSKTPLRVVLAGDHAGFPLKSFIAEWLSDSSSDRPVELTLKDCGAYDETPSDYPTFAIAVAAEIVAGRADKGILVCGSGVGVSVAANKVAGIRAAVCHDSYTAHQGVEHDDMNVLCVGGRVIGPELAKEVIKAFLKAEYTPKERHARRLEAVLKLEREGLPKS